MEPSILVVGDATFRKALEQRVQSLAQVQAVTTLDMTQASLRIQTQPTDVLVVQAGSDRSLDLCRQVKTRSRLGWTYCLMVDGIGENALSSDAHSEQLARQTRALNEGFDAYLWLHTTVICADVSGEVRARTLEMAADRSADLSVEPLPQKSLAVAFELTIAPVHERLLQAQLRQALQLIHSYRELLRTNDLLSTMALVDPLTDLRNRRALDWDLPRQVQRSRDRNAPLSLIIFDLDHFKSINDNYGHLVGDVALKLLSARLRHNLRCNDTLFRYGGEEFVVLLSDTHGEEAADIARRLCMIVSCQSFTINDDLELQITVSVGVTTLDTPDDPQGLSLIERADQRLRQAKQTGRNRVVSA